LPIFFRQSIAAAPASQRCLNCPGLDEQLRSIPAMFRAV
jgi:hypothetical protein